jgi:hypothetical protein
MRKKILTAVCATALAAAAALAVPTSASAAGYGKDIKDGCGASYGQLVSTARAIGHIEGSVGGAKNFVESGLAAAHGCS